MGFITIIERLIVRMSVNRGDGRKWRTGVYMNENFPTTHFAVDSCRYKCVIEVKDKKSQVPDDEMRI